MTQVLDAIYEHGAFRPLATPDPSLAEGQHVRLVVEADETERILELAAKVYEGLSEQDVRQIERIALDRSDFFSGQDR